jgi:hypothetical protein
MGMTMTSTAVAYVLIVIFGYSQYTRVNTQEFDSYDSCHAAEKWIEHTLSNRAYGYKPTDDNFRTVCIPK